MRRSVIKSKLMRSEPVLLTQLHLTDPSVFELASLMGFDGLWMDLEHHGYSVETAGALMRAARCGASDILARPAKGEFPRMSRLLEVGAQGLMYPRCENAAEAAEVIKWSKFAPLGRRGFDGSGPDVPYCAMPMRDYIEAANEQTFIVIQIEDPAAVEHAEDIARVPGVDGLFFGPADYSILSGAAGNFSHPAVISAMEKVAQAARKAGKHWGTTAADTEHARKLLDSGATLLCHGADILMIKNGLSAIQQQFAPLGFQFQSTFQSS